MRKVQDAEDALDKEPKALQPQTCNKKSSEVPGPDVKYSAAKDVKKVLEKEGGKGVQSAGLKYEKREANRGVNQRYWHVREIDEKLFQPRCVTIKIPEAGVTFKDMYHYYTCPELGLEKWTAALRRVPCNCPACDDTIRLPPGSMENQQMSNQDSRVLKTVH